MLKNIPPVLSPELLKILMEMGHGDEIVIADGNFPSSAIAQRLVRLDGHGVSEILEAVMRFFPLDAYTEKPVALMEVVPETRLFRQFGMNTKESSRPQNPSTAKLNISNVLRFMNAQRKRMQ